MMHSFTGTIIVFGSSHNLFDISTNLRTFGNECSVAGTQSNVDAVTYYYYYYGSLRYFGFWMNGWCEVLRVVASGGLSKPAFWMDAARQMK